MGSIIGVSVLGPMRSNHSPSRLVPDVNASIALLCHALCGVSSTSWPDSRNINYYADGAITVDWHADDEVLLPNFVDLRFDGPRRGDEKQYAVNMGDGTF